MFRFFFLCLLVGAVIQMVGIWHFIPWAAQQRFTVQPRKVLQDSSDASCDQRFDEMKQALEERLRALRRVIYNADLGNIEDVSADIAELERIEREYPGARAGRKSELVGLYLRYLDEMRIALGRTKPAVSVASWAVGELVQSMVDELPLTTSRRWSEVSWELAAPESGYPLWRAMKKKKWAEQFSRAALPREVQNYLADIR